MPIIPMEKYEEQPVLPEQSIVFIKVDQALVQEVNGQRGTWHKLEFTFKMLGVQVVGDGGSIDLYDPLIGQKIYGAVPYRFNDSAENKLKQWAECLFGMELGIGFELDTDLLIKREARGITTTYDKKATDIRTGLPFKGHRIESLLPKAGQVLSSTPAPMTTSTGFQAADPWTGNTNGAAVAASVGTMFDDDPPPF